MAELNVLTEPVKIHLAVNVSDLERSVAFYRVLFGVEPSKCHDDYAKFDLVDPPTVFSLVPSAAGRGGVLSHLGLRLTSLEAVRAVQVRLAAANTRTREQNDTRGCYAVQTKVWVEDPDQNLWEVYIVHHDIYQGDISGACSASTEVADEAGPDRHVLYKGPFREITDAAGRVFRRGEVTAVTPRAWESLRQGPSSAQFVFLQPAPANGVACSITNGAST